MTLITFQDGKVVLRDGKVGTEQACCCQECVCPELCDGITFDVQASIGGMTVTASSPIPGTDSQRFDKNDGSGDYIELTLTVVCGELGPDDECGWLFTVGVCYQSNGVVNGETLEAFQAKDADGCPDVGVVDLVCLGFCSAVVTGQVA
jgi:hypothetical protein